MSPVEVIVSLGSLVLIAAILIYFFGPKDDVATAKAAKNIQTTTIVVDGAYVPAEIKLKVGLPAEIIFDRRDNGECTDWVIFDQFPNKENKQVKSYLPSGKRTPLHFTPIKVGTYGFACGMGMNRGQLIVTA